jgi:uncharacterized protein (TIGR02594 family)
VTANVDARLPEEIDWPTWALVAKHDVGVRERPGLATHPRIAAYYKHTSLGGTPEDSTTPWCSAALCCWMEEAGYRSPRRANARSWLEWGDRLDEPKFGCIAVLWRGDPTAATGHVGLYAHDGDKGKTITLLSGNSGNSVGYSSYGTGRVLAYRWPSERDWMGL